MGSDVIKPDFSVVFGHSGMRFNTFWERDRHTESIDSPAANSVRNKILAYEAYYDQLMARRKAEQIPGRRPRFRVLSWTDTMERAEHILAIDSRLLGPGSLDSGR